MSFFKGRRHIPFLIAASLFPLFLLASPGCGELTALLPGATEDTIDPNTNFDSDGRKIAGGCNLDSLKECYQYSNEDGYGTGSTDYLVANCNADHLNGEWIPRGCPTSSAYGYCKKNITSNYWVRHYYYTGHTMSYGETVDYCQADQETWRDP
jgi:hypothetical protein